MLNPKLKVEPAQFGMEYISRMDTEYSRCLLFLLYAEK